MAPHLKISQRLIDRLLQARNTSYRRLYGIMYKGTLLIIGFKLNINSEDVHIVPFSFVTEIDFCGVATFGDNESIEQEAKEILKDVDITDNPVILNCKCQKSGITAYFYVHGQYEEVKYEILSESDIWKEFVHIRLQARLPLTCDLNPESLHDAFEALHKKVVLGQVTFQFLNTSVYLMGGGNEGGLTGLTGDPVVGELCDFCSKGTEGVTNTKVKKKKTSEQIDILPVTMFWKPTTDVGSDGYIKHAPIINHNKRNFELLDLSLKIDNLSMIFRQTKVINLYAILLESLSHSIKSSEICLKKQLESNSKISLPVPYHFLPQDCGHFITWVYAASIPDKYLENERRSIHDQLLLPLTKPYFKRVNAFIFNEDSIQNGPLFNPHEGLISTVKNGEVYLVKGRYTYHHYMQDSFNDDGWGCAYRSLQTLCSWFWWQGYSDKSIPNHKEIQECLVNIGDKPRSFINSKQWIGSTEVSFCLESMLGVLSRIMTVNSGSELAERAPELAMHFKSQGTPVMIGGGVLAHTILGIDYNKNSGEIKFLILDPHYTGADDLGIIQGKGWCGWKSAEFWKKDAYYNLCLPQVPYCI